MKRKEGLDGLVKNFDYDSNILLDVKIYISLEGMKG